MDEEKDMGKEMEKQFSFQIVSKLAILVIGIVLWFNWMNGVKQSEQEALIHNAKRDMLTTLKKYSTSSVFTVDDYDIEKEEIENTYEIYKVIVNKSDFTISGYFYVALIKSNGSSTDKVIVSKDLYELKETIKR